MITVTIVEDNAEIAEELQFFINRAESTRCIGTFRNAGNALRQIPLLKPDVIVMDVNLPDGSGIECTSRLKRLLPETQILMFTVYEDQEYIVRALEAGASGYLLKSAAGAEVVEAICEVQSHGAPMSREVARKLVDSFRRPAPPEVLVEALTLREAEILGLLGEGLLYKEVAERLKIKMDTVGSHVKNIYRKLHVRSRTEAVLKYRR